MLGLIVQDLLSALWRPEGPKALCRHRQRVGMGDVDEGGKVCRKDHEMCGPFAALAGF
jgi:hypothetical protein